MKKIKKALKIGVFILLAPFVCVYSTILGIIRGIIHSINIYKEYGLIKGNEEARKYVENLKDLRNQGNIQ